MVRAFDDPEIVHVEGEVNPIRDLDIISEELIKKDQSILGRVLQDIQK